MPGMRNLNLMHSLVYLYAGGGGRGAVRAEPADHDAGRHIAQPPAAAAGGPSPPD